MYKASILKKPVAIVSTVALASAMLVGAAAPAYASDVPWNAKAVITVMADDPTFNNAAQYIDGKIVFGSAITLTDKAVEGEVAIEKAVGDYLQNNVTIAGRTIKADSDGYTRNVSDVAVDGTTVTFKIGPNTEGMTANYSAEFKVPAVADANVNVADAMGNADSETIIGTKLAVELSDADEDAAIFEVTARAQARSMNHILITDEIDGVEQAIFKGTGTFANGGITIHSHSFFSQYPADYATAIVDAASAIKNSGYAFEDLGDGEFSIVNENGSSENIRVYVYDCTFLNLNKLAVGQIYEKEWSELHPEA